MFIIRNVVLAAFVASLRGKFDVDCVRDIYSIEDIDKTQQNFKDTFSSKKDIHSRHIRAITNDTTPVEVINHTYYTSAHHKDGSKYFLDLRNLHQQNNTDVYFHRYLTKSYGRVHSRRLRFKFPFYGHEVDLVRIATGGFLHIGPVFHSFITETQYVAPLMANFNPTVKGNETESMILVYDDGERFTTQWDSIFLNDQKVHGSFTFQVSIFKNGSIIFAYKRVPVPLSSINTLNHPVRVGLSDAFIITRKYGDLTHRRIYRYHEVQLQKTQVLDGSAFRVHPVRNCVTAKTCNECLGEDFPGFTCRWCNALSLCSDKYDWYRQKWNAASCNTQAIKEASHCEAPLPNPVKRKGKKSSVSPGVVAGCIFLVILILAVAAAGMFYCYAHTHPNTRAGLYVIEHGPRTWFKKKDNTVC